MSAAAARPKLVISQTEDTVTITKPFFGFLSWHLSAWECLKQIVEAPEIAACLTDAQRELAAKCAKYPGDDPSVEDGMKGRES